MPELSRWHIKSGLLFLLFALLLAVAFRAQPFLDLSADIHTLRPVYYHALMVGWITQIIIGVSFWMFPRQSRELPRGSETLGWITFYGLNAGLLLRVVAEPLSVVSPSSLWTSSLLMSGFLQWLAALTYVANIWRRIKLK